jgi:hypothetical protein
LAPNVISSSLGRKRIGVQSLIWCVLHALVGTTLRRGSCISKLSHDRSPTVVAAIVVWVAKNPMLSYS